MNAGYQQKNRPVHLARRDVYFERAVQLLYVPVQMETLNGRLHHVEHVLDLLDHASDHAASAEGSLVQNQREGDFLHFLQLIFENVRSVHAMFLNQMHLDEEESFLYKFLAADPNNTPGNMPALDYSRRAEDILKGLWDILRQALAPYRTLQRSTLAAFTADDRSRYQSAYDTLRSELEKNYS